MFWCGLLGFALGFIAAALYGAWLLHRSTDQWGPRF